MSGSHKIGGLSLVRYGGKNCGGAVRSGNAGCYTAPCFDRHRKTSLIFRGILFNHQRQVERIDFLTGHGQANKPPSIFGHKINGFRCHSFSSHGKIPLVFTVFVINENDHTSGPYFFNRFFGG